MSRYKISQSYNYNIIFILYFCYFGRVIVIIIAEHQQNKEGKMPGVGDTCKYFHTCIPKFQVLLSYRLGSSNS